MKNRYVRVLSLNVLQFALLVVLFVGLGAKELVDPASNRLYWFAFAAGAGSVPAIVLTLLFYKFVDKRPLRDLRFTFDRRHARFSLVSSLYIAGLYLAYCLALAANGVIDASWNRDFFANAHAVPMFLAVGFAWFLAALNEELVDRAYFVANFKNLSPVKLYVYSSVLFMIMHVFKGLNPFYTTFLLIMGMIFMYVYMQTGSVLAATMPHFALNYVTGQLVGGTEISLVKVAGDGLGAFHMGIFAAAAAVGLLVLTKLFYRDSLAVSLESFRKRTEAL